MPHYFFDTCDDGILNEDDMGLPFPDIEAARIEAAKALAELARDLLPGSMKRTLSVQVRDGRGAVLTTRLQFEAIDLRTL